MTPEIIEEKPKINEELSTPYFANKASRTQ